MTTPRWPTARASSRSADAGAVHRQYRRRRAPLDARHGEGMGHRRVLDASRRIARTGRPRGRQGQAERAHGRDPASDRPQPARRLRHASWASARSSSTATCCRPTAAPAPPASAAATSPCTTPSRGRSEHGAIAAHPLASFCAAISVGIVGGVAVLDLPYVEDSTAEVDMNVVTLRPAGGGDLTFVEVQGTAEGKAFTRSELDTLLGLAESGLRRSSICRPRWWRARLPRRT